MKVYLGAFGDPGHAFPMIALGGALAGPPDHVRERLAVYRDAGVGTLGITPLAWDRDGRLEQLRIIAELAAA